MMYTTFRPSTTFGCLQLFTAFVLVAVNTLVPANTSAQGGDLAVYDTFQRYAPAVFSVSVEIPKDYIMQQYEENVAELKRYQESMIEEIAERSQAPANFHDFDSIFSSMERQLEKWKERLLNNNRVRGAAFAVDEHHLVTSTTVVRSATLGGAIHIIDDNKNAFEVVLKGMDTMTGIAVLQIKNATFQRYVNLDSDYNPLPVASYVMTIERPYDLPASPQSGMIGGYYGKLNLFELERYIHTDLPLYPGNEGAPVFSPSGQLVGMLAATYPFNRWPAITFVIPADMIIDSACEIIQEGYIARGEIPGVSFGFNELGYQVQSIDEDSPYSQKLQKGDIVIGIEDKMYNDMLSIEYQLKTLKPNQDFTMHILRGDQQLKVKLKPVIRQ